VFGTQRAANDFVQVVKRKGIEDVRVGPYISPDARRGLELRGGKDVVDALLGEVASEVGEVRTVACPSASG
jgi:arabinogalactan endo-1,4-beta-galactosidase